MSVLHVCVVLVCVYTSVYTFVRLCTRLCIRLCVRLCIRLCMRLCTFACTRFSMTAKNPGLLNSESARADIEKHCVETAISKVKELAEFRTREIDRIVNTCVQSVPVDQRRAKMHTLASTK